MVRAVLDFVRRFPARARAIVRMVNDPALSQTYYPDEEVKGRGRALLHKLWWLLTREGIAPM